MPLPTLGEGPRSVHVKQERATGTEGSEHAGERLVQIVEPQEVIQAVVPRGHEIKLIVETQSAHVTFDETDFRTGLAGFASGHSEHRGGSVHARDLVPSPRNLERKCPFSARDVKDSIGGEVKRAEDARQQLGNSRAELVVSVLRVDLREIGAVKRRHPPTG